MVLKLNQQESWVPGHEGVEGNEVVDIEAKAASSGSKDDAPLSHPIQTFQRELPWSAAALRANQKREIRSLWTIQWAESKRAAKLSKLDRRPPGRSILKFYEERSRQDGSLITQLRSGHVGLNTFLGRIQAVDSSLCVRCHTPETVEHFLLSCAQFRDARHKLRLAMKKPLLLRVLLGNHENAGALLDYIHSTNRFPLYNIPTV